MNTITVQDGTGATTSPVLVLGYETARESRNIVHDTLDGGIAVSMIPPRPRSGVLRLFYLDEATAAAALELHGRDAYFTLDSDERPSISMAYIIRDALELRLDEDTRERWTLDVGYQEIEP